MRPGKFCIHSGNTDLLFNLINICQLLMNKRSLFPTGYSIPGKARSLAMLLALLTPGIAPTDLSFAGSALLAAGKMAVPDRNIRGKVTDEKGDGLPGVNVL